jgi:hypothetical protein
VLTLCSTGAAKLVAAKMAPAKTEQTKGRRSTRRDSKLPGSKASQKTGPKIFPFARN